MDFGIDRLGRMAGLDARLRGARVGVLAHAASVDRGLVHLTDKLARVDTLFGPEHGFGAAAQDMASVADARDARTGARIVSLYGDTPEDLVPRAADLDLRGATAAAGVVPFVATGLLIAAAARGARGALPLLVLVAALDLGWWGLGYVFAHKPVRIEALVAPWRDVGIDKVAGIEARGFILGGAVAHGLKAGFVPIRKRGKLPHETVRVAYSLEYGVDEMEMHRDAVRSGEKVLLIDDLVATGGTAAAAAKLLKEAGADMVAASFVIDLPDLGGATRLRDAGIEVQALLTF